MKQRPDGDIEIEEKFWEEEFHIPNCERCDGVMKPDVVFFGDNVPKGRAGRAMEAAEECDSFLGLGSSMMTMSAFRLIKAEDEAGATTAIVNVGVTRADDFIPLKINARLGEILQRLLSVGSSVFPQASAGRTNKYPDCITCKSKTLCGVLPMETVDMIDQIIPQQVFV